MISLVSFSSLFSFFRFSFICLFCLIFLHFWFLAYWFWFWSHRSACLSFFLFKDHYAYSVLADILVGLGWDGSGHSCICIKHGVCHIYYGRVPVYYIGFHFFSARLLENLDPTSLESDTRGTIPGESTLRSLTLTDRFIVNG